MRLIGISQVHDARRQALVVESRRQLPADVALTPACAVTRSIVREPAAAAPLVARRLAEQQGACVERGVVAVATPHLGEPVIDGACAFADVALTYYADLLYKSIISPPWQGGGASDGLIPVRSQRWPGAEFEYLLDGST